MSNPLRVQMSGPLSAFAGGFLEDLIRRGYRPGTAAKQLQLMAHLSRWLAARDLEPAALSSVEIERFVQERRASHSHLAFARGLQALLEYLRGLGVVPPAGSREARTPAGALLDRYAEYLLVRRGVSPSAVRNYCNHACAFLADRERITDDLALVALDPAAINEYVLRGVAARERLLDASGRPRAAVAAAVPAARGADRSRPGGRRAVGGQVAVWRRWSEPWIDLSSRDCSTPATGALRSGDATSRS